MKINLQSRTTLHNKVAMPWMGLGVFKLEEGEQTISAIHAAVEFGYRGIDTASKYGNEKSTGQAVKTCGIPREELFITSKLWNSDQGYKNTIKACETSLKTTGLDYLDLYLIHWPVPGIYMETWKAMEKLYKDGKVRAIGVSNFHVHHLKEIMSSCNIIPMANQAEFHPYLLQKELLDFCRNNKIQRIASVPLMKGKMLTEPVLKAIAENHGKTSAQVALRWDLQHQVVTIPKSSKAERIRQNGDLFDFELTPEEMSQIDMLDKNTRIGPHPDDEEFYKKNM